MKVGLLAAVVAIRDLLFAIRDFLILVDKKRRENSAREAVEKSTKDKTQKPLEEQVSSNPGKRTKYKYHGLSERKRKSRD